MINRHQPVYDIAALCAKRNLKHAIVCPGSRNAPLTLAFTRHSEIRCRSISDERSAAFIALGMSQHFRLPTVLICTSGSAAYNFAPAVAEAFFAQTPLLILTADRPSEWIAQQDGQTIFQQHIFGKHVKGSFALPEEYEHSDSLWAINRIVNEAINLSIEEPAGPVHINIPFREPLYPEAGESIEYSDNVRVIEDHSGYRSLSEDQKQQILNLWPSFSHILVLGGQHEFSESRRQSLENLLTHHNLPLAGDILSNLHGIERKLSHTDSFLAGASEEVKETLKPDLLVTFGNSIISKNLKLFLRAYAPKRHWHIQPAGPVSDTFQSVTDVFRVNINAFFNFLSSIPRRENFEGQKQNNYTKLWEVEERRARRAIEEFFPHKDLGEFELVREIIQSLPPASNLHLANSMSVRYANYIGLTSEQHDIRVYGNRGTSGIDGCTSTAVGHALSGITPNFLITGDMAFFYDRNAFWHNYGLPNLRIVLLNNHGGIIFKMIDGPAGLPESDEYFVTKQRLNAAKLCEEFGFEYLRLDSKRKIKNLIADFIQPGEKAKVLEIESSIEINKNIFEEFKIKIKKSYEL